jgi:plastocyanin
MFTRTLSIALLIFTAAFSLRAGNVEGTILIQHKLTKRKVTPSPSLYERGMHVDLGSDQTQDPLLFERSHVVVYLEGDSPFSEVTAELDQQSRRFSPDLVVIPAGSSVSFPNLDPIFHNVFSLSKAKSFDLGNYPKDPHADGNIYQSRDRFCELPFAPQYVRSDRGYAQPLEHESR